jgi:hypothetical protein
MTLEKENLEMTFNESQSHAALDRLIRSGKVTEEDVSFALAEARTDIEMRLAFLRSGAAPEPPRFDVFASVTAQPKTNAVKRGRPRRVSPQQAASRRIQGVYLSLIRRVPKSRRIQYQIIAKRDGREAAISAMRAR